MTRPNYREYRKEIREERIWENSQRLNDGGFDMILEIKIPCSVIVKEKVPDGYDETNLADPVHFDRVRIYEGCKLIAERNPEMVRDRLRQDDDTLLVWTGYSCVMKTNVRLTGSCRRGLFREKAVFDRSCRKEYRIVFCYDGHEVCKRILKYIPDYDSMVGWDRRSVKFPGRSAERLIRPHMKG